MMFRIIALAIAVLALAPRAESQSGSVATPVRVPYGVGERLEYEIRYGPFKGAADMEITELDTVRGRQAWHAEFSVRGGIPFFRVNDRYETWIDTHTIASLRYKQDIHDGSYERHRIYEFLPDKRMVIEGMSDTTPTVERPVDDASILYFLRTIDLRVGLDTGFNNYFLPDRNPIRIRVLGRERITVPAGDFDAIIIQPQIKAKGIFSEGGQAQVWLSDDDKHIILKMTSKVPHLPIGSLNLYLKSYRPSTPRPSADKP
jgi:Protein of unknown function (DUF3108)